MTARSGLVRLRFRTKANPTKGEIVSLPSDTEVSFVPMEAIGENGVLRLEATKSLAAVSEGYTYFREGDVIIAKITPCFENGKGAVAEGLRNGVGFGTTELHVLRPLGDVDARYLYYLSCAAHFRQAGAAWMTGAGGQKRVPEKFVKDFRVAFPTISEQRRIAAALDNRVSDIDCLIRDKQNVRALLREQRLATISRGVTGLDRRDLTAATTIPWLQQLPKTWDVRRLRFLAQVRQGIAKGRKLKGDSIRLPYLRVANVQDGYIDLSDIAEIEVMPSEVDRYALRSGDLLMNEGGDYDKLGRGAVWRGEIEPCLHQNHVFAVRFHDADLSTWVSLVTQSAYAKHYFMTRGKQSTNLASISSKNLKNLPVVIPPRAVRDTTVKAVLAAVRECDELSETVTAALKRLEELRTAVITEQFASAFTTH